MTLQSTAIVDAQSARPLRHWSDAQLARARGAIERVCLDWSARWQLSSGEIATFNACDIASATATASAWERGPVFWLSSDQGDVAGSLQALLLGSNDKARPDSPIASGLANEAVADLLHALGQLSAGTGASGKTNPANHKPPESDMQRWSGAIRIRFELVRDGQSTSFHLHVSEAMASVLCGGMQRSAVIARPALVEVTEAIATQSLDFKVTLDETTLTLGTLQSLHVGDVLPLSHHLDQPLHVVAPGVSHGASIFCAAYLGSRDHHRAVELVPAAPAFNQIDP